MPVETIARHAIKKPRHKTGEDALKTIQEPQREIPVLKEVDVAVVGGGAAGICAAVASARNGANALLIEASAFLVGYICSGPGSTPSGISFQDTDKNHIIKGIPWEMMQRLVKAGDAIPQMEREVMSFETDCWDRSKIGKLKH